MKDHRNNYATDTTLESDVGYEATVGDPVVEAEMTVDGDGIIFPCKEMHEGNYLVTLEVNGVPILYRESVKFEEEGLVDEHEPILYDVPVEATVNGIKIHYDGGEVEVTYDVSDGDVVRLTIEPLEVKVTDGFRAAVKKACNCDSSSGGGGGGGGGGVLKVTVSRSGADTVLDKNWTEISEALENGIVYIYMATADGIVCDFVIGAEAFTYEPYPYEVNTVLGGRTGETYYYSSNSATGVLVKSGGNK